MVDHSSYSIQNQEFLYVTPLLIHPGIYRITLDLFGNKPGPVNTYLFRGRESVTLLDTGTHLTTGDLSAALSRIGLGFGDIDQVVLSHGHVDHYGAALEITRHGRAKVLAHTDDIPAVERGADAPMEAYRHYMKLTGTPKFMRLGMVPMFMWLRRLSRSCPVDQALHQDDTLVLGDYTGRIIETPGHTRGSVCVYLEDKRILFSGDHILEHITPNALPMFDQNTPFPKRSSQKEFYASLEKIKALEPRLIHPAHGIDMKNFKAVHTIYKDCFAERQGQILDTIRKHPGRTFYTLARAHFPHLNRTRFFLDLYLAVSEIFTHVHVLVEQGDVRVSTVNNTLYVESNS